MAELGLTGEEYTYLTSAMAEAGKLLGQKAYLYHVVDRKESLYHDVDREYGEKVQVGCFFLTNPQPILKRNKWLVENEEAYVAYISLYGSDYTPLKMEEGCILEMHTKFPIPMVRHFKISIVQALTIDPLMWMAKLVPYREKLDMKPESTIVETVTQTPTPFNNSLLKR